MCYMHEMCRGGRYLVFYQHYAKKIGCHLKYFLKMCKKISSIGKSVHDTDF